MQSNVNTSKLTQFLDKVNRASASAKSVLAAPIDSVTDNAFTSLTAQSKTSEKLKIISARAMLGVGLVSALFVLGDGLYESVVKRTEGRITSTLIAEGYHDINIVGDASRQDCRVSWLTKNRTMVMRHFKAIDKSGQAVDAFYCKRDWHDLEVIKVKQNSQTASLDAAMDQNNTAAQHVSGLLGLTIGESARLLTQTRMPEKMVDVPIAPASPTDFTI